jgi:hypothetical protein
MEIVELLQAKGMAEGLDALLCTEALDEPLNEYVERTRDQQKRSGAEQARLARLRTEATRSVLKHFAGGSRAA